MELIAGADVRVWAEDGSRRRSVVVVSFSQTAVNVTGNGDTPDPGDTDERAFASTHLRALGVNAVFVVARWRHGWQTPEMTAAIAAVRAHIARHSPGEVVVIGASLGGFGALVFAASLGATRVLALAPQASVDLWKLRWDPRSKLEGFARLARQIARFRGDAGRLPHDDMSETLQSTCPKFIFYDALTHDRLHAGKILGNNVVHVPVFHVGHQVTRYLRQTGVFSSLLEAVIAGDADGVALCAAQARRNRRRSAEFRDALAEALPALERHPALARRALRKLSRQYPRHLALRHAFVKLLLRQGRTAAALVEAAAINEIRPDDEQARAMVNRLRGRRERGRGRQ